MPMGMGALAVGMGMSAAGSALEHFSAKSSAKKQMSFQRKMDNTKRRRDVIDLRAAGLNPILAAGFSGSAPSGSQAVVPQFSANSSRATSAASELILRKHQAQLINAQTQQANTAAQLNQAAAGKTRVDSLLLSLGLPKARTQAIGWAKAAEAAAQIDEATSAVTVENVSKKVKKFLAPNPAPSPTKGMSPSAKKKWRTEHTHRDPKSWDKRKVPR